MPNRQILLFIIPCFIYCIFTAHAENLIKNSDLNAPLGKECRIDNTSAGHVELSQFTEDLTWNKCAKLELIKFIKRQDNHERVCANIIFGGGIGRSGFPVKPNTTYDFSLELKGTAAGAAIKAVEWNATGRHYVKSSFKKMLPIGADWQVFKGTFKTSAGAKQASLNVQLWWDTIYGPMKYKIGDYLLIDNVKVEEYVNPLDLLKKLPVPKISEKEKRRKIAIAAKFTAHPIIDGKLNEPIWSKIIAHGGFAGLKSLTPKVSTKFKVFAGDDAIYIGVICDEPTMNTLKAKEAEDGTSVWKDDVLEIFFGPVVSDRKFTQLVIAAGGGRWMGNGITPQIDKLGTWEAKVDISGSKAWTMEMRVPYKTLGWKTAPISGDSLKFNIARQRNGKELSTWSILDGSFHDLPNFSTLIIGGLASFADKQCSILNTEVQKFANSNAKMALLKGIQNSRGIADPSHFMLKLMELRSQIRGVKLGGLKFVVTMNPPTTSPIIPLIPRSITNPPKKLLRRIAINDIANFPMAITNLTGKLEEYRVELAQAIDYGRVKIGLKCEDGREFPVKNINMLRGVRVKDRDSANPTQRFDPLTPLDPSQTVAAAPNDSALLWLQFDCTGVASGKYQGFLRVIPLSEPATLIPGKKFYKGDMIDLPIELNVLPFNIEKGPVKPWDFMKAAYDEQSFKTMYDQGIRYFKVSPWFFNVQYNSDGTCKNFAAPKADKTIQDHLKWAKKFGVENKVRFAVEFSVYGVFYKNLIKKQFAPRTAEWEKAWRGFLKGIGETFKHNGVTLDRVALEVQDEPGNSIRKKIFKFDTILAAYRIAKEELPLITTYAWLDVQTSPERFESFVPYMDAWGFHRELLSKSDFAPLLKKLRENGNQIWMYACNDNMNSDLYQYYRKHAWIGYYNNVDTYGLFFYSGDYHGGWDRYSWKIAKKGGIVYRAGKNLLTSIRNECLKIGNQDIKYLEKLKQLISKAKNKKANPEKIKTAEKTLDNAIANVLISKSYDAKQAEKARSNLIQQILYLTEK